MKLKWHTEKRKISDLVPYENNPRKLTDKQAEDLKSSIEKFDLVEIPAINLDGKIIAGHQRLKILQLLGRGEESVDVRIPNRPLTDKEFQEYCLRSNKNTGEWDFDILSSFEKDMLLNVGFLDEDLENIFKAEETPLLGDADDIPSTPDNPKTKLGDLYTLGNHRLLCGDSTVITDVQNLLKGNKIDLVFTDPPYNINYDFHNNGMVQTGQRKARFGKIKNDHMKDEDYRKFIYDVFTNLHLVMKEGASFYISGNRGCIQVYNDVLSELDFYVSQWIIWVKENFNISRLSYHPKHEIITFGWKKGKAHKWYGNRSQTDVWEFARNIGKSVHPTEKPVDMLTYLIKNSSKQNENVLDFFGGSGSTIIACEKANRKCFTMELDPKYCDVIVERWESLTNKKSERVTCG